MHAPAGAALELTRFVLLGFTIRKFPPNGNPKDSGGITPLSSGFRFGYWANAMISPLPRFATLAVQLVKKGGIFFGEGCASQQLRAVAQRLRKRHFAAPATNLLVVAAHEHLRHLPAAKFRGPGVVRIVQDAVTGELWFVTNMWPPLPPGLRNLIGRCQRMTGHGGLSSLHLAERLVYRRSFVSKRPGQQASHCIHNHRRGQLAAREDKIADGDLLGGQVLGHALVHALVAPAQQHNMQEPREAARRLLAKEFARS